MSKEAGGTTWVKNQWYVAAWDAELDRVPLPGPSAASLSCSTPVQGG
ncbi:hypothetical protein [Rhizorhapis suberifaciens]|uniref:Uncharacterized protein n=1 Tax=Rhizorhapis suberifaciens TaxID=13656 RepID=A0A840HV09_9SPHN|nr:hypothetical protein [Rhizorhapis suberifaciens]MBB4641793.1 hypothetical protein [Rhizorhapis suberifaciens]